MTFSVILAESRSMSYPTPWDPFVQPTMTLADVYHYPTQHFDFHRRQLSGPLAPTDSPSPRPDSGNHN